MPLNNYILKNEKAMTKELYSLMNREYKLFIEVLKKQDTQKGFLTDVQGVLSNLKVGMVDILTRRNKRVIQKGSDVNARKYNPTYAVSFDTTNSLAGKYLESISILHLSEKQGSIYKTTKKEILGIIDEGIQEGISYTAMAKKIQESQPFVFSKARAELIAVTEVGRAYEFGNYLPMKDLQNQGATVLKAWSTVGDNKVRPTHAQNEADGYIPLDNRFSGTGDTTAPAKLVDPYRCRCSTIYNIQ